MRTPATGERSSDTNAGRGRVVLVTSSVPGEGKSTTALALARTYAAAGKKVLLIDADLRKPSLHHLAGVEAEHGFADYLRDQTGHATLKELCRFDTESSVTLLLGKGQSAALTDQLLSSKVFKRVIAGARQTFDVILVELARSWNPNDQWNPSCHLDRIGQNRIAAISHVRQFDFQYTCVGQNLQISRCGKGQRKLWRSGLHLCTDQDPGAFRPGLWSF